MDPPSEFIFSGGEILGTASKAINPNPIIMIIKLVVSLKNPEPVTHEPMRV